MDDLARYIAIEGYPPKIASWNENGYCVCNAKISCKVKTHQNDCHAVRNNWIRNFNDLERTWHRYIVHMWICVLVNNVTHLVTGVTCIWEKLGSKIKQYSNYFKLRTRNLVLLKVKWRRNYKNWKKESTIEEISNICWH